MALCEKEGAAQVFVNEPVGRPPRRTSRAINSSLPNSRAEVSRSITTEFSEDRDSLLHVLTSMDDGSGASVVHAVMRPKSKSLSGRSHSKFNAAVAGPARGI